MCNLCDTVDEFGDYNPCCDYSGVCEAYYTEDNISSCVCCGAEMHLDESDSWRHHSQMDLPLSQRYTIHHIQHKPNK